MKIVKFNDGNVEIFSEHNWGCFCKRKVWGKYKYDWNYIDSIKPNKELFFNKMEEQFSLGNAETFLDINSPSSKTSKTQSGDSTK